MTRRNPTRCRRSVHDFTVAELDWETFYRRFDWRQGEHVSLIAPTGGGKTTLAVQLLPKRQYVAAIGTKPEDDTFRYLLRSDGYRKLDELPHGGTPNRVVIWPKYRRLDLDTTKRQAAAVRHVIEQSYSAGHWCLFVDEVSYASKTLKLRHELEQVWDQGRAVGLSLIGGTQRPAHVPLQMYSAATHLFLSRTSDARDIKRLAEMNGGNLEVIRRILPDLDRYEFLYVDTRTGSLAITKPPRLDT